MRREPARSAASGPPLHIGIADFSEPTLLILGESEGFLWLADLIESRWTGNLSTLVPEVRLANIAELELTYPGADGGAEQRGSVVHWRIQDTAVGLFPERLRALARCGEGHHYLDAPPSVATLQVVASKGEYDPRVIFG